MALRPSGYFMPKSTMGSRGARPGVPEALSGGVSGVGRQSRERNPSLSALAGVGQKPSSPNARIGTAQTQGGTAPYEPTTSLNQDQQSVYDAWFADNDKNAQMIQDIGNRNIAAMGRKNASLAAMSGSGGGAAYLQGQRAALSSGLATMDNALLANNQARSNIYGSQAGQLGALATGAQQYGNQMGLQTQQQDFQAGREDQKAKTDAQTSGIQAQAARAKAAMDSKFGDNPNSDVWYDFNALQNQLDQAIAAGNFTLAQQLTDQMNNFDTSAYRGDGKRKG